jgi:hypothetical protein
LPRRVELTLALLAGLLTLPAVYSLLRLVQARYYPEPDPALVVWSTRTALYWRCGIASYAAMLVAIAVFRIARADLDAAARWLQRGFVVAVVTSFLQGIFVP